MCKALFREEIAELVNAKNNELKSVLEDNILKVTEKVDLIDSKNQEAVADLNMRIEQRLESLSGSFVSNIQNLSGQMDSESNFNEKTKEQINILFSRIDDIHEKLYEFEISKKNNLIFYGITGDHREKPSELMSKVCRNLNKYLINFSTESMTNNATFISIVFRYPQF